jgi:hypothetical protein
MPDDYPEEVKRAAKLKALWEELSFALYDLEGFMANRDKYYAMNSERSLLVDHLLHYIYVKIKDDYMVQHFVKTNEPLPDITVDRDFQ